MRKTKQAQSSTDQADDYDIQNAYSIISPIFYNFLKHYYKIGQFTGSTHKVAHLLQTLRGFDMHLSQYMSKIAYQESLEISISCMGNSQLSKQNTALVNFPIQRYLNQGLNQSQILKIKAAFDSYCPEDGKINTDKIRKVTEESKGKQTINRHLHGKTQVDFDEFFQVSKELLQERMRQFPNMEIDIDQVQVSCLFCPYAVDKKS